METPEDNPVADSISAANRVHIETGKTENKSSLSPPQKKRISCQISIRKAFVYFSLSCAALGLASRYREDLNLMVTHTDIASDFYLQNKIAQLAEYDPDENPTTTKLFLTVDILKRVKILAEDHNTSTARVLAAATDYSDFKNKALAVIHDAIDKLRNPSQQTSPVLQQEPAFKVIRLVKSLMRELDLTEDEARFSEEDEEALLLKDVEKYYPDIGLIAGSFAMLFATMDAEDSEGLEKAVREKLGELNIILDDNIIAFLLPELQTQMLVNQFHNSQNGADEPSTEDVASR